MKAPGLSRRMDAALMGALADAALAAGALIMGYCGRAGVRTKDDGSPVTEADVAAEAVIRAALHRLLPDVPVLAEEEAAQSGAADVGATFVAVDALDGTKEFVAARQEFTVNIGLIEAGQPVGGVVFAPALERIWLGWPGTALTATARPGSRFADRNALRKLVVRTPAPAHLVAVVSRTHGTDETEAYLGRLPIAERCIGGSSLKFCHIAEGRADVYPRFGTTMEWDTAAGHAIVLAAGGAVWTGTGDPLGYGKFATGYRNPPFVVAGDRAGIEALLDRAG